MKKIQKMTFIFFLTISAVSTTKAQTAGDYRTALFGNNIKQ
jgi:hypothetical protein